MEKYSGKIQAVVFKNPDDHFYIMKILLDKVPSNKGLTKEVIATGKVFGVRVQKGTWLSFEANITNHAKYGNQLKITKAPAFDSKNMTPKTIQGILQGQGVSELVARAIVKKFGESTYGVLSGEDASEALQSISGINMISADFILQKWRDFLALHQTFSFFEKIGLSSKKYQQVFAHFGSDAKKIISEDPYLLTDIEGITFEQADAVASHIGIPKNSVKRTSGLVFSALKSDRSMGHLYLTPRQVFDFARRKVGSLTESGLLTSLIYLHNHKRLVFNIPDFESLGKVFSVKDSFDLEVSSLSKEERYIFFEKGCVYSKWNFLIEQRSAEMLLKRRETILQGGNVWTEVEKTLEDVLSDDSIEITLSELQKEAIVTALSNPISVITGLPGTGKTTTLKVLVKVLDRAGITFQMVAPTAIAAKRISQVTSKPAYTIHRAFGSKGGKDQDNERENTYYGVVGEKKPSNSTESSQTFEGWEKMLSANILICDEASMVDQHLLYRMLKGTHGRCQLVFVGDHAQLPSVGAGDVLKSLLHYFPSVALTEIFRQSDTSDIVYAAHDIHKGNTPDLGDTSDSDFVFISCESHVQIQNLILKLSQRVYEKRVPFQVLSPRHSSELGVTELNQRLRELLNTTEEQSVIRVGSQFLRENDRVMITKNDYNRSVFNGDTGKIYRIMQDKKVIVKIHGEQDFYVDFTPNEISKYLRLAYCTTVHKMQGQETGIIIMPLVRMFSSQLQRNLLYTAITRAKEKVILIGHQDSLIKAIDNDKASERNTRLLDRLQEYVLESV
jgi:exodeoxyribonuclease V alpha subunit